MRSKNNKNFERTLIRTQSVVSLKKMQVSRRWGIFIGLVQWFLHIKEALKMKLLQMIFLVLIVSACSSPKPDNFANAKYEFAQFVRMAVHLDDQFIHEAHNYRAENRHLTGDKAQKQKSVLKWLKEIHSKQIQKMNSLEIEDPEVNRLRTLFIQNRLYTEKAVENDGYAKKPSEKAMEINQKIKRDKTEYHQLFDALKKKYPA